jgi:hypothetical protein
MFIPDPDADFLPIPDPVSRGQKGTGSRIRTLVLNTLQEPLLVKYNYEYLQDYD